MFGQPEVRHISNTSFMLAALSNWKQAHRWALTGDNMGAEEALRIGVVTKVVPEARPGRRGLGPGRADSPGA